VIRKGGHIFVTAGGMIKGRADSITAYGGVDESINPCGFAKTILSRKASEV
jgi:hypothetical protein